MWKILMKLFGWLSGLNLENLLGTVARVYEKRADTALGHDKVTAELTAEIVRQDIAHIQARRDLGIASMSHPVWWVAWALFVIPVGLYHAGIFLLSIASIGPETYAILKVPPEQEAWARQIVASIFTLQAAAGVSGALLRRWSK